MRALALKTLGKLEEANVTYREVLTLEPGNEEAKRRKNQCEAILRIRTEGDLR